MGFDQKGVLRWRMAPGEWRLEGATEGFRLVNTQNGTQMLVVQSSVPIVRREVVEGWESRHYMEKTEISVLEVEVHEPCKSVSELSW